MKARHKDGRICVILVHSTPYSTRARFVLQVPGPYNHPQPSICHKTMAVKWHSKLSRRCAPLTGNLLSLLPQQRFTFAAALQEGCVARWWRASATALQTVVPPLPPLRILYSLLRCCPLQTAAIIPSSLLSHRPSSSSVDTPSSLCAASRQPPLTSATSYPICSSAATDCRSSVAASNNALPLPHSRCFSTPVLS